MNRATLIAAIAAAAMGAATFATMVSARSPEGPVRFETLDADGDGQITQAEMQAHAAARFATADTNEDGALSADELMARGDAQRAARIERMIQRLDTDGDSLLSQSELEAGRKGRRDAGKLFERADANGDGMLSQEEFDTVRERMRERRASR